MMRLLWIIKRLEFIIIQLRSAFYSEAQQDRGHTSPGGGRSDVHAVTAQISR